MQVRTLWHSFQKRTAESRRFLRQTDLFAWRLARIEQVIPYLLKGLNDKELRVASGCLSLLQQTDPAPEIKDTLHGIARKRGHQLRAQATVALCRFSEDRGVAKTLAKALDDPTWVPAAERRADIAEALGDKAKAVALLLPPPSDNRSDWDNREHLRRLGRIGHPSAIPYLQSMTTNHSWHVAVDAFKALAQVDPKQHGLTDDQISFLGDSSRLFKASRKTRVEWWSKLAKLDRKEIRPLVMRNLQSDNPTPALIILSEWQDKEALPEIRRLMKKEKRSWRVGEFTAASLAIDSRPESIEHVMTLINLLRNQFRTEDVLRAIARWEMPNEDKLRIFHAFREKLGNVHAALLPKSLWQIEDDIAPFLGPLMSKETRLPVLCEYAKVAARDKQKRFDRQILTVLERLAAAMPLSAIGKYEVAQMLDTVARYGLEAGGKPADHLLRSSDPNVAGAAARLSAKYGGNRDEALALLGRLLRHEKRNVRLMTAKRLQDIPCVGEGERIIRENDILSHLGTATEDCALRVLTTCAGDRTAKTLAPLLDENNVPRAVYAAWVLAQHPDKNVSTLAVRRLAVYAMFNHQMYQQGAGIDFPIACNLSFHQVTSSYNPGAYRGRKESVQIPGNLLTSLVMDTKEKAFSIRAYRHIARGYGGHRTIASTFLFHPHGPWNMSHVPLLRVVAVEDPYIEAVHIKGKKVAHFRKRRCAAQALSKLLNGPMKYLALDGARIVSDELPSAPYDNQDLLLARHALDMVQASGITRRPENQDEWTRHNRLESAMRHLVEQFGLGVERELLAEAKRRKLTDTLKTANFRLWNQ